MTAKYFLDIIEYVSDKTNASEFVFSVLIDSAVDRAKKRFFSKEVVSPDSFDFSKKVRIIVCVENNEGIYEYLSGLGMRHGDDYLSVGEFLAEYVLQCLKHYSTTEKSLFIMSLFHLFVEYKNSHIKRHWVLKELFLDLLFLTGKEDLGKTSIIFEKLNGCRVVNLKYSNMLTEIYNKFSLSSVNAKKMIEKNQELLCIDDKLFDNEGVFLGIDNEHFLLHKGNTITILTRPISLGFCISFFDLSDERNAGIEKYVQNQIKKTVEHESLLQIKRMIDSGLCSNQEIEKKIEERFGEIKQSELKSYIMAYYYYKIGELAIAKDYVLKGIKKRQLSMGLCELAGDIFFSNGEYLDAIGFYSRTMMPFSQKKQCWMVNEDGSLVGQDRIRERIIECISKYAGDDERLIQECCDRLYRELEVARSRFEPKILRFLDGKFYLEDRSNKQIVLDKDRLLYNGKWGKYGNKYLEGERQTVYSFDPKNETYHISILRLNDEDIFIEYDDRSIVYGQPSLGTEIGNNVDRLKLDEWVTLRISKPIRIESKCEFVVGKPRKVNERSHDPMIINVFLDGLPYGLIKNRFELIMPNTYRFFSKGTIFDNCYSVGEWTQTNYPSMFLGVDVKKLECFHPRFQLSLPNSYKNITSFFEDKGYDTLLYVDDVGCLDRFYAMGATRGYTERYSIDGPSIDLFIDDILYRLSNQKNSIFVTAHCDDVHDSHFMNGRVATRDYNSAMRDFCDVMINDCYSGHQVDDIEESYSMRLEFLMEIMRDVDFKLNSLYSFLEDNYCDDDFFVALFSDHGLFGRGNPVEHEHVNNAFMFRGRGVPKALQTKEVLSNMDLFSIYKHIFGLSPEFELDSELPEAFGGRGREFSVSQWRYPRQRYRMAINSIDVEFILETINPTNEDGTIDLGLFTWLYNGEGSCFNLSSMLDIAIDYLDDLNEFSLSSPLLD